MNTEQIEKGDVDVVLAGHNGNRTFGAALERAHRPDELLRILGRYIYFNSPFGSGVANLAGEIAARQDLFRDPEEEMDIVADRSFEVAAQIFSAAIDEFGDRGGWPLVTHRSLAQATLKGAAAFYGFGPEALSRAASPNQSTVLAMGQVSEGYGVNQAIAERDLFRGIGFHMCSEILADGEFQVLDRFLRARHRDLVENLENSEVLIGGVKTRPYYWIHIHTTVEADHFNAAVAGSNSALRYYCGHYTNVGAKACILDGFKYFAAVQTRFMEGILDP